MREFLDTSVMIAAFFPEHPHREASLRVQGQCDPAHSACALHSLAEVYSGLTRIPGPGRAAPDQALLYLGSLRERLTTIALGEADYARVLDAAVALGLAGGAIYDALLGQCAAKCRAEVIYTWNRRDFLRLGTEIAGRVRAPGA